MVHERDTEIEETMPSGSEASGTSDVERASSNGRPRLAEGVELLGEYRDSGYVEPPLMARRADGGMIQLPPLLYAVAERMDGRATLERISDDVSEAVGRRLEPDDIRMLVDEKLASLGVGVPLDGGEPPETAEAADPLLALRLRTKVVPDPIVRGGTTLFKPLFFPPLLVALIAGLIGADAWFFLVHGLAQPARELLHAPILMLAVVGLIAVTAAFHEFGHATGCRYGGAQPGAMGVGIYIVWPAFYTDISDSHRLGRWGRLRADLGGVYFNGILSLVTMGIAVVTGFEALFVVVLLQQFEIARQMLPVLRMDGYYVVSDLVGVPDLFGRIKPILLSFLPGRDPDPRVIQLKPWVRIVVTSWVLGVVAFLGFYMVILVLALPRLVATGWASFWDQFDEARTSFGAGQVAAGVLGGLEMLILLAPVAGIAYLASRLLLRWWRSWTGLRGRPLARLVMLGVTALIVGLLLWAWWPSTQTYRPIGQGERWTVSEFAGGVVSLVGGERAAVGSGPQGHGSGEPTSGPAPGPTPAPTASASAAPTPSPSGSSSASATASPSPTPSTSPTPTPTP